MVYYGALYVSLPLINLLAAQMAGTPDTVIVQIDQMINQLQQPTNPANLPNPPEPKILKVNDQLRRVNEQAYNPKIVSIGPIHHGNVLLKVMEEHKLSYYKMLKQRKPGSIETCVVELRILRDRARGYYSADFQYPTDENKFLTILLLDGIFVIELLRKLWREDLRDQHDLVFGSNHVLGQVTHDLLLIENQLPLFVIHKLFELTKENDPGDDIQHLITNFLGPKMPWRIMNPPFIQIKDPDDEYHHILGLLCTTYYSFVDLKHNESSDDILSASELKALGIKFKLAKNNILKDIKFARGILELPRLIVSDETESILRNLVAYEQSLSNGSNTNRYVTDYVVFMQCLISSKRDATMLRRSGILVNRLGDDEMVFQMVNKLMSNVITSLNFSYKGLFGRVNAHCDSENTKMMASLHENYCNSFWGKLSVAGAISLLVLTILQAAFAVVTYIKQFVLKQGNS